MRGSDEMKPAKRGVGMRRRRYQHEESCCEDGFGEGDNRSNNRSNAKEGRHLRYSSPAGEAEGMPLGGRRSKGGSREASGGRRPALVFLAQAVLSFVGMVVLPTRLAYEVLVQPRIFDSMDTGSAAAPPLSLKVVEPGMGGAAGDGGGGGRNSHRRLGGIPEGGRLSTEGSSTGVAWGHGSRGRFLQAADGDSFTYTARTQFHLCARAGTELTEDALRAGIVDVFGVEPVQTEAPTGDVTESQTIEFCGEDDIGEWSIAIGNDPTASQSAAAISAEQMELVRSPEFATDLAASINGNADLPASVTPAGLSFNSLGYIVLYDEDQALSTAGSEGLGDDFVAFRGPDQWWPWWAWIPFAILLCSLLPLAYCIYHFRPGYSGPPSPSGAGGGPGMFGQVAGGKGVKGGKGGGDADWDMKQFEKGAAGGGYGDKDEGAFNDAATGISTDSPTEYVNPGSGFGDDASGAVMVSEGDRGDQVASGEWPEALESGIGVTGADYTSQGGTGGATPSHQEDVAVPSEADRAAGVDPGRQHEQESAYSMNPLVTSASFNPTPGDVRSRSVAASAGSGSVGGAGVGSSTGSFGGGVGSFGSSYHDSAAAGGSEASWAPKSSSSLAVGAAAAAAAAAGGASLQSGPSGRSLGSAAAALGEEGEDTSSGFGGGTLSYRTEGSTGARSTSTLAALEAKAEADAYEAELAASSSARGDVGSGSIGGPAVAAAAAFSLPPSGRSSGRTSHGSATDQSSAGGVRPAAARSRAESGSSGAAAEELRDVTDEERQARMEDADAARAASLLRGSSFKVPLQPDLERAITEEEQERRRQAVRAVEESRAPIASDSADMGVAPGATVAADTGDDAGDAAGADDTPDAGDAAGPTEGGEEADPAPPSAASMIGKIAAGIGMGRFFGIEGGGSGSTHAPAPSPAGAPDDASAEPTAEADSKAAPPEDAAAAAAGDGEGSPRVGSEYVPVTGEGTPVGAEGVGPAEVPPVPVDGAVAAEGEDGGGNGGGAAAAAWAAAGGQKAGAPSQEEARQEPPMPPSEGQGRARGAAAAGAAAGEEGALREGSLSPEEARAYSEKVDRTLQELPDEEGGVSMPMSELLARAELEVKAEEDSPGSSNTAFPPPVADTSATMGGGTSSRVSPSAAPPPAPNRTAGLPPPGPGQAAALARQQQPHAPALDISRLLHTAEESGMTLEELEGSLASPIVATPPALLRPGVGHAARGGSSARGRNLLHRSSASGSFVSSRSTSITEDMMSNNLTEDDMSSDAHTTDVSRTSSYVATGSSFEESLAQSQAASGRFLAGGAAAAAAAAAASAAAGSSGGAGGANPSVAGGGGGGSGGEESLSSLAERLARVEETVGREHEKGLLYRQGPEGVAAAVAGEELPLPPGVAASLPAGYRGDRSSGGGASSSRARGSSAGGAGRVESLADILARADDGPGNLKETFRLLDDMEAKRLEDLNAAASAEGADDETKARWRGSLAELMVKVDRSGNLRDVLDLHSESESASASDGKSGTSGTSSSDRNYEGTSESDSASGSASRWNQSSGGAAPQPRPE